MLVRMCFYFLCFSWKNWYQRFWQKLPIMFSLSATLKNGQLLTLDGDVTVEQVRGILPHSLQLTFNPTPCRAIQLDHNQNDQHYYIHRQLSEFPDFEEYRFLTTMDKKSKKLVFTYLHNLVFCYLYTILIVYIYIGFLYIVYKYRCLWVSIFFLELNWTYVNLDGALGDLVFLYYSYQSLTHFNVVTQF